MATLTLEAQAVFGVTYANPDELWLGVFFTPTEASQAAGRAFLRRFRLRVQRIATWKWARRSRRRRSTRSVSGVTPRPGAFDLSERLPTRRW